MICENASLEPPRVPLITGVNKKRKEEKRNTLTEQVSSFSRSPRPGPHCGSVDIERLDHGSVEAMGRETWKKRNRGLWSEEKRGSHGDRRDRVHSGRVKMPSTDHYVVLQLTVYNVCRIINVQFSPWQIQRLLNVMFSICTEVSGSFVHVMISQTSPSPRTNGRDFSIRWPGPPRSHRPAPLSRWTPLHRHRLG